MSYDISLIDKKTNNPCTMSRQKIRGGTVPAEIDPKTGRLIQASQTECSINITYNYSSYYYEATENNPDFNYMDDEEGEICQGIRGLYGKTARESIPLLEKMIEKITESYQDENHNWKTDTRIRVRYFYEDGTECTNPMSMSWGEQHKLRPVSEMYEISEGDTSDYWEGTAANAIIPLTDMLNMALYNIGNKDVVWDGD